MTDSSLPSHSTAAPAPLDALAVAQARARAWASLFADGTRSGVRLGRYVLLEELGAGAMGLVYAAYDPELDRKVAIKVLRGLPSERDAGEAARLVLEARALAKLSHPNVVAVHDVGLVEPEGMGAGATVFLAMEHVRGTTLRRWLGDERRSWREIVAMLEQAGRGLAAAHEVGLVHRDFKPDNVMVGEDGRARVMDFGLARLLEPDSSTEDRPAPGALPDGIERTQTGVAVGTPAYMALEQHQGREVDARSDQFAFCVVAWEALFGERPFAGSTRMEVALEVYRGRLRPPPKGRRVPSWLRRVCERGLATEPSQRWPSMQALLEALARGRTRARVRTGLVAVGALALLGVGVEGWRRLDMARRTAACEATGEEIATAWNPERAQALRDGMRGTGSIHADTVAGKAISSLDQYAEEWRQARVDACLDADVHGTWDADTRDRALWCLDERRTSVVWLVRTLSQANRTTLQRAVPMANGLGAVAACRDLEALEVLALPPEEHREELRLVRNDLTEASIRYREGRYDDGIEIARQALARAVALEWRPLEALARYDLGVLLVETGAFAEAESMLEDAYFEAEHAGDPKLASEAAIALVQLAGYTQARYADGHRWGRHAAARLADTHGDVELLRSRLLATLGYIDQATGDYPQAEARYEEALSIREAVLGPAHTDVASTLQDLASIMRVTGAPHRAKALYERALAINREALFPDHPHVATSLNNLSIVQQQLGEHDEARRSAEEAVGIYERILPPDHLNVGISLNSLANALYSSGAEHDAVALRDRIASIFTKAFGPEHPHVAAALSNLGTAHADVGDLAKARAFQEQALAIREKVFGPEHADVGNSLVDLAEIRRKAGALDDAEALFERALGIFEAALGSKHPQVADALIGLAEVALARRRAADALPLSLRAAAIREQDGIASEDLAWARFVLAQALWDAPEGDRERAVALAEQAHVALLAVGKVGVGAAADVERWLAGRRGGP